MKELTKEDKARRYDEVSKQVKDFFEGRCKMQSDVTQTLEYLFPELEESEDEKIRKKLLKMLNDMERDESILDEYGLDKLKTITWLEKIGEHLRFCKTIQIGDRVTRNEEGVLVNMSQLDRIAKSRKNKSDLLSCDKVEPKFKVGDIVQYITDSTDRRKIEEVDTLCNMYHTDSSPIMFEIEDEWKVVVNAEDVEQNPTDKTEPKFKVGDWIIQEYVGVYKVIEICKSWYEVIDDEDNHYSISFDKEGMCHLWTVKDAKEGDVLSYVTDEEDLWIMIYWSLYEPYEGHVHYHALLVNDNFGDKGTCCICIDDLKPATKEQRDILFKKMKENGYEWDAENKKLTTL